MKNVLIFGAGRVAGPCVRHLLEEPDLQVVVVDRVLENALKVVDNHPRGKAVSADLRETDELIKAADLVVSLMPRSLDLYVIKKCLEFKKSLVFPNFLSPEINELAPEAREAGLTMLGEIGLDPGIDHMSAVKIIDQIKAEGGKITGFRSWCGGLPAPEAANEPLRYKFSWSPEGAIEASACPARYLQDGKEVNITGDDLMKHYSFKMVPGWGWFEEYPNSDAIYYIDVYGIPEVETIYRGTFRYPGWCETIACLNQIGLFGDRPEDLGRRSYRDYIYRLIGASESEDIKKALAAHLGIREYALAIKNIEWLGLLDQKPLPFERASAREVLADLLLKKLSYEEGERDLVVMLHEFDVKYEDGRKEQITSTLVEYGEPEGDSAMARTTGLPVAAAALLIVTGRYSAPGIHIPVDKQIYGPVLDELARLGICLVDSCS